MLAKPGLTHAILRRWIAAVLIATVVLVAFPSSAQSRDVRLRGTVVGAGQPLAGMTVSLYETVPGSGRDSRRVGSTVSGPNGTFAINFRPPGAGVVLHLIATGTSLDDPGGGDQVMLAAVLGTPPVPGSVVINERTTVSTAFAMAQFLEAPTLIGNDPGLQNAAHMYRNVIAPANGVPSLIATAPNGAQTSASATLESMANVLAACVGSSVGCQGLFASTTQPGGSPPTNSLDAFVALAHDPSWNADEIFQLSFTGPSPYPGALPPGSPPDAWFIALRFVGDGHSMNGPGTFSIDAQGTVWTSNNYEYAPGDTPVCGGRVLLAFTPRGAYVRGSPFRGGGLSGAGWGIAVAPNGHVWVGNFGFAGTECPPDQQPPHNSMSEFSAAGIPLSGKSGYTNGDISWPQGTVSDRDGNIWIANCGNSSVTRYAAGDHKDWLNVPTATTGLQRPFGVAIGAEDRIYVGGNDSGNVAILRPNGEPVPWSPVDIGADSFPLGLASDAGGNMWVTASHLIEIPCPSSTLPPLGDPGWMALLTNGGQTTQTVTGGGLTIPWGTAVDGNGTVWVANFAGKRLSRFCGVDASCPRGLTTGEAISPDAGYGFDGLVRNTGVAVDPSGNVWIANNWKEIPFPTNPGGYEVVVFLGLAGPIQTPILGPPQAAAAAPPPFP